MFENLDLDKKEPVMQGKEKEKKYLVCLVFFFFLKIENLVKV